MKKELQKLHERIKKLTSREQDILRLRYSDGLNYKDLAAAAGGSQDEVIGLLLGAINSLRGMPGGEDKGRFLSFVHGELNEADTQKMAEWVENDPEARKEFESLLAMSDALTDLYDALRDEKPGKESNVDSPDKKSTLEKIRDAAMAVKDGKKPTIGKPRLLIAGAFFAVAALIVLFIAVDMGSSDGEMSDSEAIAAAKAADAAAEAAPEPAPMPEPAPAVVSDEGGGAPPPVDNNQAVAQATAANPPAKFQPPPPPPAEPEPPAPAPAPAPAPTPAKAAKKMAVDSAKTVIPKNINKRAALAFFGKKLNNVPSCIPAADKKSKSIKTVIGVTKDGTYTTVSVQAPAAHKVAVAKCLKAKLGATAKSLKTNNRSGGKITLVLKVI